MSNVKIYAKTIEQSALDQINLLASQDAFKDCKIRIMPDVHSGAGCVIGFTADLGDKVIPNIVGVDIGCGMLCLQIKEKIDVEALDNYICKNIPSGMNVYDEEDGFTKFDLTRLYCYDKLKNKDNWIQRSMGTLGGGNHFIEVDVDKQGQNYLVIHSGSRNLGKQVCDIYQEIAIEKCSYKDEIAQIKKEVIRLAKEEGKEKYISSMLKGVDEAYKDKTKVPKELSYLTGEDAENYLHDMKLCQEWAEYNRVLIATKILVEFNYNVVDSFESVHNYIDKTNMVRKGAISARLGEKVIIPMNMRDGCIIGLGKGNEDWNESAPHGAGRLMSRAEARKKIDMVEYKNSMNNIYTTSVCEETKDEAPMVYKPMEEIKDCIKDTVEIMKIIKPIYNFKAKE